MFADGSRQHHSKLDRRTSQIAITFDEKTLPATRRSAHTHSGNSERAGFADSARSPDQSHDFKMEERAPVPMQERR